MCKKIMCLHDFYFICSRTIYLFTPVVSAVFLLYNVENDLNSSRW